MWDSGHLGLGVLRGHLFQDLLENSLAPVESIEECHIPLGVTAYNLQSLTTTRCTMGKLATAVRASCTFPVLFQPVHLAVHAEPSRSPSPASPISASAQSEATHQYHIDGGIFDDYGFMALPPTPTVGNDDKGVSGGNSRPPTVPMPRPPPHVLDDASTSEVAPSIASQGNAAPGGASALPPLIVNIIFDGCQFLEEKVPDMHKHCRVSNCCDCASV